MSFYLLSMLKGYQQQTQQYSQHIFTAVYHREFITTMRGDEKVLLKKGLPIGHFTRQPFQVPKEMRNF